MPILPEEITTHALPQTWWRGYHPRHVEQLLTRVADDYTAAIARIAYEATQPPDTIARTRKQADQEADIIRARAQQAADNLLRQAERTAQIITEQATALRAQAQHDADTARTRLEQADAHARHLEHTARQHWDTLRADAEHRWQQLHTADRRLNDRARQLERALATLRSRLALLDHINELENTLTNIRTDTHPHHNGTHAPPDQQPETQQQGSPP